jgi:hypothetical protein
MDPTFRESKGEAFVTQLWFNIPLFFKKNIDELIFIKIPEIVVGTENS